MATITTLLRTFSIRLLASAPLLLAFGGPPAAAQRLALQGNAIPLSGSADQAGNAAVAMADGTAAVTYNDDVDAFVLMIAESNGGIVTTSSPQLVASNVSAEAWIVPNPSPIVDYVYMLFLPTNPGPVVPVVVDNAGQPGASMTPISSDGSFDVDAARGSSPGYRLAKRLAGRIATSYVATSMTEQFSVGWDEAAFSDGLRIVSMPSLGSAQRTTAARPSVLVTELANDAPAGSSIYGRFFDESANPIGDSFPIHPPVFDGFKLGMDLAASPSGVAMVVWEDLTVGRQPAFALVDPLGPVPGSSAYVSNTGIIDQSSPRVAVVGERFVVTWRRRGVNGGPDTIQARFIDASEPTAPVLGPEVEVSGPAAAGSRLDPAIAADESGSVLVVWTETAPDLLTRAVLGQRLRLEDPLFEDGFESGNTAAWSTQAP